MRGAVERSAREHHGDHDSTRLPGQPVRRSPGLSRAMPRRHDVLASLGDKVADLAEKVADRVDEIAGLVEKVADRVDTIADLVEKVADRVDEIAGLVEKVGGSTGQDRGPCRQDRGRTGQGPGPCPEALPEWRLGLNVEFSLLPDTYDRGRWGNELRPIGAFENQRFAVNPIVDSSFAGPDASAGPTFEPCVALALKIHEVVSVGVEHYMNPGPISAFLPWQREEQHVYEVFDLLSVKHFERNAGVGEGLTDASNRLVFTMILGYAWESDPPKPRAIPPMTARR